MGKKKSKKNKGKKNHYWVGFQREGDTIEIKIKDYTNKAIEKYEINISDKKKIQQVLFILKRNYNIKPEVCPYCITKTSLDEDLKWLS